MASVFLSSFQYEKLTMRNTNSIFNVCHTAPTVSQSVKHSSLASLLPSSCRNQPLPSNCPVVKFWEHAQPKLQMHVGYTTQPSRTLQHFGKSRFISGLTHPVGGRDRGRAAAGPPALPLSLQSASQWSLARCSPAGRQSPGCSAASGWPRCADPSQNRDPGHGRYAWRCPCACGWCSWLWGAEWMWRRTTWPGAFWMSPRLWEAWRRHLKDRLDKLNAWSFFVLDKLLLSRPLSQDGLTLIKPFIYFTNTLQHRHKSRKCCRSLHDEWQINNLAKYKTVLESSETKPNGWPAWTAPVQKGQMNNTINLFFRWKCVCNMILDCDSEKTQ